MTDTRSLMDFVPAPIVVGDPDGRSVYVNPAFEGTFEIAKEDAVGQPLAALFDGGTREAILNAVAGACGQGRVIRFRIRDTSAMGFAAMASPIVSQDEGRVGVLILMTEEPVSDERLMNYHREVQDPLDTLTRALAEISEQLDGRRPTGNREALDEAVRCLSNLRKQTDEIHALLVSRHR